MKKTIMVVTAWVSCMVSISAFGSEEAGFGGEIILGGWIDSGTPSQLDPYRSKKTIGSINDKGKSDNNGDLYLSGELNYTLEGQETTFYLSSLRNNGKDLSAGITQSLEEIGVLEAALSYASEEVWRNPYLIGSPRKETDEIAFGGTLSLDEIMGTGLLLSAEWYKVEVDNDDIGNQERLLRRDGFIGEYVIGYGFAITDDFILLPMLQYGFENRDGEANSNDSYGGGLWVSYSYGKWGVEGEAMLAKTKYREDHPLYNKERKATEIDLSTIVSYNAPFDIPDVAIYGFVGYSKVDENIGFFDSDTLTLGVGIGYEF